MFSLNVKMSLIERFINACKESDLENVKNCLERGVDVNTVSEIGPEEERVAVSGLTIAAGKGYLDLLDLLLSQPGINVNLPLCYGELTLLMFACNEGNHRIVKRLLQVPGINIFFKDSEGNTALHVAAYLGHSKCLEELAKIPGVNWNCKDNDGLTPLFLALHWGHPDCVRIIASQPRVDVADKTNDGETLVEAAMKGYYEDLGACKECIQILADINEVDWNIKMSTGDTPIVHCLYHGYTELLEIFAESPWVNLNIQDDDGDTPIIWCLKNEMMEEFKIILACPRVELGSAITWAFEKKKMNIVEQLGQALDRRFAEAKNRFQISWRGGASGSAGMRAEMSNMKIGLQLASFRKKIQAVRKMDESNNNYEEK